MPNRYNINSNTFTPKTIIYLVVIAILIICICILNAKLIPVGIALFTVLIIYANFTNKKRMAELSEQLKDLTLDVNNTAKTTLINSPFPLVMMDTTGNMIWKSEKFVSEFGNLDISEE